MNWFLFRHTYKNYILLFSILFLLVMVFFNLNIICNTIFLSIISSICASLVFFFSVFYFGKPSLILSEKLINQEITNTDGTIKRILLYKFINATIFRISNIKIKIFEVSHRLNSGIHFNYVLKHSIDVAIPFLEGSSKGSEMEDYPHAMQINLLSGSLLTVEDIKDILNNPSKKLMISIESKHTFTNISTTFHKFFDNIRFMVEKKEFKEGNSLEII